MTLDIVVNVRANLRGFVIGIKNAEKSLETFNSSIVNLGQSFGRTIGLVDKFPGHLLTFLFAGMQINRLFTRMGRETTEAFQKVMQSVEGNVTALTILQANWEFLKFTIGNVINEVLMPLLPQIISIIQAISEWVLTHPKIVAWGLAIGVVGGKVLEVFGNIGLFIFALKEIKVFEGMAKVSAWLLKITGSGLMAWSAVAALGLIGMWAGDQLGEWLGKKVVSALTKTQDELIITDKIVRFFFDGFLNMIKLVDEFLKKSFLGKVLNVLGLGVPSSVMSSIGEWATQTQADLDQIRTFRENQAKGLDINGNPLADAESTGSKTINIENQYIDVGGQRFSMEDLLDISGARFTNSTKITS